MSQRPSQPHPSRATRSLPHKRPYLNAMLFTVIQFLFGTAFLTVMVILILHPTSMTQAVPLLLLGLTLASWGLAYGVRRLARCPLCKGTPLIDSAAVKHQRARKPGPLNQGVTAMLSLLLTLRFRCMYCGTLFDLLRNPGADRPLRDPER